MDVRDVDWDDRDAHRSSQILGRPLGQFLTESAVVRMGAVAVLQSLGLHERDQPLPHRSHVTCRPPNRSSNDSPSSGVSGCYTTNHCADVDLVLIVRLMRAVTFLVPGSAPSARLATTAVMGTFVPRQPSMSSNTSLSLRTRRRSANSRSAPATSRSSRTFATTTWACSIPRNPP